MTENNPLAGYIEAQMSGTAGIVQAAMHGMQRVQEIMLRAMREGAGDQLSLARSITEARDPSELSRLGSANAAPTAENFARYQQELMSAVTEMNTDMIQASYSLMERVSGALAASASAMGLPAGQATPIAAFEAGVRQWQGAMDRLAQGAAQAMAGQSEHAVAQEESGTSRSRGKQSGKRSGRR